MPRGKKRKVSSKEYEYIEIETDQPFAMIEGMTKTSAKQLIQTLHGIAGDYDEHQSKSRLRRFVYQEKFPKELLSSQEKQQFIDAVIADECGAERDILALFPQFQEVLDYKKGSGRKYYHTEKRLKIVSTNDAEGVDNNCNTSQSPR